MGWGERTWSLRGRPEIRLTGPGSSAEQYRTSHGRPRHTAGRGDKTSDEHEPAGARARGESGLGLGRPSCARREKRPAQNNVKHWGNLALMPSSLWETWCDGGGTCGRQRETRRESYSGTGTWKLTLG